MLLVRGEDGIDRDLGVDVRRDGEGADVTLGVVHRFQNDDLAGAVATTVESTLYPPSGAVENALEGAGDYLQANLRHESAVC